MQNEFNGQQQKPITPKDVLGYDQFVPSVASQGNNRNQYSQPQQTQNSQYSSQAQGQSQQGQQPRIPGLYSSNQQSYQGNPPSAQGNFQNNFGGQYAGGQGQFGGQFGNQGQFGGQFGNGGQYGSPYGQITDTNQNAGLGNPTVGGVPIVAVKKNGRGNITHFMLGSGQALTYEDMINAFYAGQTDKLVYAPNREGEYNFRSTPDGIASNNLDNLPMF